MTEPEQWAPIPGYPAYEASSLGLVRRASTGRILAPWWAGGSTGAKYAYVTLYVDGRRAQVSVHLAVCAAFHGPRPPGTRPNGRPAWECDHRDGDQENNRADNLEWVSREVNLWRSNGRSEVEFGPSEKESYGQEAEVV